MTTAIETFPLARFIERTKEIFTVPYELIQVKPDYNSRKDYGDIEWLSNSIVENGLKQPLLLFVEYTDSPNEKSIELESSKAKAGFPPGWYNLYLSDGHRRYSAIQKAIEKGVEFKGVLCRCTDRKVSEAERILDQLLLNSGKNLTPLEQQDLFSRLKKLGWTDVQISKQAGVSISQVINMLELSSAPSELKTAIEKEEVSATTVVGILSDLKQVAIQEGIKEEELFQEMLNSWKQEGKGKKLSGTKAKEMLEKRKISKLNRIHPDYYKSLTIFQLVQEMIYYSSGFAQHGDDVLIQIDSRLYQALKSKVKQS